MATTGQGSGTDAFPDALQGRTVEEAARALTVFMRYVRRGSKGKGPHRVGARPAYPIEYFAVLERHTDFAENGFHWHLLLKGAEFIPHEVLKEAWCSARHGAAYIVHIESIRKPHVIGYVTKYLTKSLSIGEKGVRHKEREVSTMHLDEEGKVVEEWQIYAAELLSRARRIRYSRHFFPEKVAELRARLFAELEQESMEQEECQPLSNAQPEKNKPKEAVSADETVQSEEGEPVAMDRQPVKRSSWSLIQCEEFTQDIKEYKRRRRKALLEALIDIRMGQRNLSRRVINIWAYQRNELRWAS